MSCQISAVTTHGRNHGCDSGIGGASQHYSHTTSSGPAPICRSNSSAVEADPNSTIGALQPAVTHTHTHTHTCSPTCSPLEARRTGSNKLTMWVNCLWIPCCSSVNKMLRDVHVICLNLAHHEVDAVVQMEVLSAAAACNPSTAYAHDSFTS